MKKIKLNNSILAIFTTGICAFLLSIIWYSPILFGSIWEQYRNLPNPDIPGWTIIFAPFRELIVTFVLSFVITKLYLNNLLDTIKFVLLLWLGFHFVGMAGAILWDNMKWELGLIHCGDWLMKMLFMGLLLTRWQIK